MKRLLLLFTLMASAAQAQNVTVKSGDHVGFTRLVLQGTRSADWTLGRTATGYALRLDLENPRFALGSVYDLITRDRIRSVTANAQAGQLDIEVACACHAIPFMFAPNILVIDLKEGPAPPDSVFEARLDVPAQRPAIVDTNAPVNLPEPANTLQGGAYDWLSGLSPATVPTPPQFTRPVEPGASPLAAEVEQQAFRRMLTAELGRGATSGVVQMQPVAAPPPEAGKTMSSDPPAEPDQARAALDELPGIAIGSPDAAAPDLTAAGDVCPPGDAVDVTTWGMTDDPAADMARAGQALLAEFDIPAADKVADAVRTYLYYGFGAEARAVYRNFPTNVPPDDRAMAISYLVDDQPVLTNPFSGMRGCDSAVALWAALAHPDGSNSAGLTRNEPPKDQINGAAASRSFMALPKHLRRTLGPRLHDILLRAGDTGNAEIVKQSIGRIVPPDAPTLPLMNAQEALTTGDADKVEIALDQIKGGQEALQTLLTRVEARFQLGKPIDADDMIALEAFAFEQASGPRKAEFDRALVHANALAGNFATAFQHAAGNMALEADVWSVIAGQASSTALLETAVGAPADVIARLDAPLRASIASRLVKAGLPNAALAWVSVPVNDPALLAEIQLANHDAGAALRTLSAAPIDSGADLVAQAHQTLGQYDLAQAIYQSAGNSAAADRLARWQGQPGATNPTADGSKDVWAEAEAALAPAVLPGALPPLQASSAQLDASAKTRAAIMALLEATPIDPPP